MSSHDIYRHTNKVLVYRWYTFYVDTEKRRYQHGKGDAMPLTDTKVRALHGRMVKGENVGKESTEEG